MNKPELKRRLVRFFYLFGLGCLVMVLIRLFSSGQIKLVGDQPATYGLISGLASLIIGYLFARFFRIS